MKGAIDVSKPPAGKREPSRKTGISFFMDNLKK